MTPESLARSTCRTPQRLRNNPTSSPSSKPPTCIRCGTASARSRRSSRRPRTRRCIWRWRDIEPFTERAVREVPIDDVERRALILVNPAFGGETVTTHNLIAAFTVLDPGDRARPHRHTFAAIRFATRAEGAATIVNGRRCEMQRGRSDPHAADVLARPHQRERPPHHLVRRRQHPADPRSSTPISSSRAIRRANEFWQVDEGDEKLWAEAGMIGADVPQRRRIRRSTTTPARRPAACWPRCPPDPTARAPCATPIRRPATR